MSLLTHGGNVMSPTPKQFKRPEQKPLPKPNVDLSVSQNGEMTAEKVRALFCNPLYAGITANFPKLVDDETWIRAAAQAIREHGSEQWLVNLLYILRAFLGDNPPKADE
jgi:hypothetical protein